MQTHDFLKGYSCPHCHITFEKSFWFDTENIPDPAIFERPDAFILIVCFRCARILIFSPNLKRIELAGPSQLAEVPPEVLAPVRKSQRQIYMRIVRAEAVKSAEKN